MEIQAFRKQSLFSIFFTFGLDNLGATIVFPIFAPLFLSPENSIVPPHVPESIRAILLGFFLGAYPFAQFLFSPVVGEFADRFGRKKSLVITTILACMGYVLCAIGISHKHLSILFLGRLVLGLAAANLAVCLATIADLSPTPKKKMHYFSYGSALAGFTFVLGPFVGGKLSDPTISEFFNPSFPMWIGGVFAFINLLFLIFFFKETLRQRKVEPFDFIQGIANIHHAFRLKKLRSLYGIYFLFLFAFNMIFQFIPAFLVQDYQLSNSRIGDITAIMGLCWVVGTALIYKALIRFLSPRKLLFVALLIFSILCVLITFGESMLYLVSMLGTIIVIAGVIWPVCTACISNSAEKKLQGKILGISQSMQSLSMMLAPFIGGIFIQAHSGIPFFIASGASLLALWVAIRSKHLVSYHS